MKHKDLIRSLAETAKINKSIVAKLLDNLVQILLKELKKEKVFRFNNLGTFKLFERKERTAINPKTKEKIKVPAKKFLKFKAAASVSKSLNE